MRRRELIILHKKRLVEKGKEEEGEQKWDEGLCLQCKQEVKNPLWGYSNSLNKKKKLHMDSEEDVVCRCPLVRVTPAVFSNVSIFFPI